jgi:hypothetical protein
MKAERKQTEPEFVPVMITLESQEEINSLYTIGNHYIIGNALPALKCWYVQLNPFVDGEQHTLWNKLNDAIR